MGGSTNPPRGQRIFWAVMEGAIAVSVLLIDGEAALETIQSAVVILGLPFSIILLMIMFSLGKELNESYKKYRFNRNITLKRRLRRIDHDEEYR